MVWSTYNLGQIVIMPLDPLPQYFPSVPLQVVSEFRYLGVTVSKRPNDYIALYLLPLLIKISSKVDAWCRFPLSVIGRGNLIKMILMPQLLYVLHNAPAWVPICYFNWVHRLFRELIWRKNMLESVSTHYAEEKRMEVLLFQMCGYTFSPRSCSTLWIGIGVRGWGRWAGCLHSGTGGI